MKKITNEMKEQALKRYDEANEAGMFDCSDITFESEELEEAKTYDWNNNYQVEKYHIEFLKETIERLEMENDALLAELISNEK
tara:strand:+ start:415 stop:663 length:249 start_codon:yes stop_codon:yes gene_type:complete